ncbi:MAG: VIT1/CCC1 transporter family protein [Tepidisphaeraceae bacterium]
MSESFIHKHLDPASRLGEILFGLIMVLTVTLTAGLTVSEGREGVRELLVAAIGCNVAWGVIDGMMYVMGAMFERSRRARMVDSIRSARDEPAALAIVRDHLDEELSPLASAEACDTFHRSVLAHLAGAEPVKTTVTKGDLLGGLASFWLVFLSCIPAVIPFLIFDKPRLALRVSNGLLVAMLFVLGVRWARYTNANPLIAGLIIMLIGLALVGVAIVLGG